MTRSLKGPSCHNVVLKFSGGNNARKVSLKVQLLINNVRKVSFEVFFFNSILSKCSRWMDVTRVLGLAISNGLV